MIPYFLLVAVPPILSWLLYPQREKMQKRTRAFMLLFFTIFFILVACRHFTVGVDNKNYLYYFEKFAGGSILDCFGTEIEPGYAILCKLVSLISKDYQVFVAVVAAISIIPVARFYMKETEMPIMTMALFLMIAPIPLYFSGLRQVIAMAFIVPAYKYVKEKKLLKFVFIILLATLFHQSSLVMILLYPAYHIKLTPAKVLLSIPVLGAIFVLNEQIFRFGLSVLGGKYEEKYGVIESTGAFAMLILFALLLVYCFIMPRDEELSDEERGLRNIMYIVLIIQMFAPLNSVIMRINYYFLTLVPLTVTKIAKKSRSRWGDVGRTVNIVMCVFFIAYFFFKAYTDEDILEIFPYVAFWQQV